jgi:hypothetical protein
VSRDDLVAVAVLGAAVVLLGLASPASPLAKAAGSGVTGLDDVTWAPRAPRMHKTRGGLFHPPACGEGRSCLMGWGWDWIAHPPSEAGLGDTQNA